MSADTVIQRLRAPLGDVAGARTFLQAVQDIRVGGRQSNAQYQFTMLADSTADLYKWGPKLTEALQSRPELADVNSDQQQGGLEAMVTIDRATAARFNIKPAQIDNTLYDAFGQRQVSTIYNALNQYHVVMEVAPKYWQRPGDAQADLRQHVGRQRERRGVDQCDHGTSTRRRAATAVAAACTRTDTASAAYRSRLRAQLRDQRDRGERQVGLVVGRGGLDREGDHGAAVGHREVRAGQHALVGQSPEPVRRLDDLVQSCRRASRCRTRPPRSTTRWRRSACPARSTAASRARRRRSSNR